MCMSDVTQGRRPEVWRMRALPFLHITSSSTKAAFDDVIVPILGRDKVNYNHDKNSKISISVGNFNLFLFRVKTEDGESCDATISSG